MQLMVTIGLGVAMGLISGFPIDLRRRPYNTVAYHRAAYSDPSLYVFLLYTADVLAIAADMVSAFMLR